MGDADQVTFSELSENDHSNLASKWFTIQNMIKEKYDYELRESENDLPYLQRVIDDKLLDPEDWNAMKRLGVAFGRALAKAVDGLDWWILEDKFGRDIVLRYQQTSLQFNVLYVIGRRLNKGEAVDVKKLYKTLVKQARKYRDVVE